jgi:hypothetical protein
MSALWALFVGVDRYDDDALLPLPYCSRDARALAVLFRDPRRAGVSASNVRLLTADRAAQPPRKAAIVHSVRWLAASARETDRVVLGFFGHGVLHEGQCFLMPGDGREADPVNTAISLQWLKESLGSGRAISRLIVLDACHSGELTSRGGTGDLFAALESFQHESEGWAILASCTRSQKSHDWGRWKHGAFTYFLLEGLRGAADTDRDGRVSLYELSNYVHDRTSKWAQRRHVRPTPELLCNLSGDVPLLNKPKRGLGVAARKMARWLLSYITLRRTGLASAALSAAAFIVWFLWMEPAVSEGAIHRLSERNGSVEVMVTVTHAPRPLASQWLWLASTLGWREHRLRLGQTEAPIRSNPFERVFVVSAEDFPTLQVQVMRQGIEIYLAGKE